LTSRQYVGEEQLLSIGFKKQKDKFVLSKRVRKDNGFRTATFDETVAEVTLDDNGYLIKQTGLNVDSQGQLLIYRRF